MSICNVGFQHDQALTIFIDHCAQYKCYISPSTSAENYFQRSPYLCQEIYIISNQQYVIYIRFQKYYSAPTYFLEHSSIFVIPDEIKLFWPFHQNENSNSIMLASVHHWISEACINLASFESTKHSSRITYTSFVVFPCRNFVLTFILPYLINEVCSNCQYNPN